MGAITYHITFGCGHVDQTTKKKVMELIRNMVNALMGDVSRNLDFEPPKQMTISYSNVYGAQMNLYMGQIDEGTLNELIGCKRMEIKLVLRCEERPPREVSDFSPEEHSKLIVQFQYNENRHGINSFDVLLTKGFPEPLINYFGGLLQVKHPGIEYLNRDMYAIMKLEKVKNYLVGFAGNWFGDTFFMHFLKYTKQKYAPDRIYINIFGQKFSTRTFFEP